MPHGAVQVVNRTGGGDIGFADAHGGIAQGDDAVVYRDGSFLHLYGKCTFRGAECHAVETDDAFGCP